MQLFLLLIDNAEVPEPPSVTKFQLAFHILVVAAVVMVSIYKNRKDTLKED